VHFKIPDRKALATGLGLDLDRSLFLLTYHPGTSHSVLSRNYSRRSIISPGSVLVFTKANADSGGRVINERLEAYVAGHSGRAVLMASTGRELYLAALRDAAVVIGNSSSGLIEAPAVGIATVKLGIRQKGRPRAASVFDIERCDQIVRGH
jgi:UDP-N-acetylglucosamine 2-epimerase